MLDLAVAHLLLKRLLSALTWVSPRLKTKSTLRFLSFWALRGLSGILEQYKFSTQSGLLISSARTAWRPVNYLRGALQMIIERPDVLPVAGWDILSPVSTKQNKEPQGSSAELSPAAGATSRKSSNGPAPTKNVVGSVKRTTEGEAVTKHAKQNSESHSTSVRPQEVRSRPTIPAKNSKKNSKRKIPMQDLGRFAAIRDFVPSSKPLGLISLLDSCSVVMAIKLNLTFVVYYLVV